MKPTETLYTWKMLEEDIVKLKDFIKNQDIDHIVTLYRGGLPIGVRLSNECDLPLSVIDYQSYKGKIQENSTSISLMKDAGLNDSSHILLFDDIADTKKSIITSLELLRINNYHDVSVMTIYGNQDSYQDWNYLREHNKEWVYFVPWEGLPA